MFWTRSPLRHQLLPRHTDVTLHVRVRFMFLVEHALIVEDYPQDASLTSLRETLFPAAIFVARIGDLVGEEGEKKW